MDRTTDGSGEVCKLPLSELHRLDAGSFFDIAYRGERIPTLNEVFEVVGRRTFINVELTNYTSPNDALPEKVVELIKHHNLNKRILFSSFNPQTLRRAAALLPEVPCGLLALPKLAGWLPRSWIGQYLVAYQALHPEKGDVTARMIQNAHRRGRRIHAWTVNEAADLRRMFALGVDGVFTDDPRLARKILGKTGHPSYMTKTS